MPYDPDKYDEDSALTEYMWHNHHVEFSTEPTDEIIELLKNGMQAFRRKSAQRLAESAGLEIARCSKCNRIIRTPAARQCLWCGHDWH